MQDIAEQNLDYDSCPILIAKEITNSFGNSGESVLVLHMENNIIEKPQQTLLEDDIESLKQEKIQKIDSEKQEKEKIQNDEQRILVQLQAENKALKAENDALKENVRRMSVNYTTSELQLKNRRIRTIHELHVFLLTWSKIRRICNHYWNARNSRKLFMAWRQICSK